MNEQKKKMTREELSALGDEFEKRRLDLRCEAHDTLREVLGMLPGKEIVAEETLGFFLYENCNDDWVEAPIHALKLEDKGYIRLTSMLEADDEGRPTVEDWGDEDRESTYWDDDDYVNVNWPLTLTCTLAYLENRPELFGEQKNGHKD